MKEQIIEKIRDYYDDNESEKREMLANDLLNLFNVIIFFLTNMIESEKNIEKNLRLKVKAAGGWALKIPASHITGLPDRICLLPGGRVIFAEIKTTKEKPKKIQLRMHEKLRALGFDVFVIDKKSDIDKII
jgi:hypothetical protein